MLMPPGKFFTMFHFLEYPFSRGFTHVKSANPYENPDFDAGFMNDKRDMAAMVWGYIKSRETARRMSSYAGEVTSMHPHIGYDSPARPHDLDLETTKAYAGPNHLTAGIQHGMSPFTNERTRTASNKSQAPGPTPFSPARPHRQATSTPTGRRSGTPFSTAMKTSNRLKNGVSRLTP